MYWQHFPLHIQTYLLSTCCFNKICQTMQCKHEKTLMRKKQRHSLLCAEGYSAEVLCYLWTMSETDDKKLSILLENISAPFLKKLIWKIVIIKKQKTDTGSYLGFGRQITDCGDCVNNDPIMTDTLGWQSNTWSKQLRCLCISHFCNFPPFHTPFYTHTQAIGCWQVRFQWTC